MKKLLMKLFKRETKQEVYLRKIQSVVELCDTLEIKVRGGK